MNRDSRVQTPLQLRPELKGTTPSENKPKRKGRRANTLVRLYHLLREYPLLKNKEIAEELGISQDAVRMAKLRLRKYNEITKMSFRYCSWCLKQTLEPCHEGLVCKECGRVFEGEVIKINPFNRSPTNQLHWGKGLGSDIDCNEFKHSKDFLGKTTVPIIVSKAPIIHNQLIMGLEDSAIKRCLEDLMRTVRTLNLDLVTTDSLGSLLRARVRDFQLKYPLVPIEKKIKQAIILDVLACASIDFPRLKEAYLAYLEEIKAPEKLKIKELVKESKETLQRLLEPLGFDRKLKFAIMNLLEKEVRVRAKNSNDKEKVKHNAILSVLQKASNDFPRLKLIIQNSEASQ